MKTKTATPEFWIGLSLLVVLVGFCLYLPTVVNNFSGVLEGIEVKDYPIQTTFVLSTVTFWWGLGALPIIGVYMSYKNNTKLVYWLYVISGLLIPVLIGLVVWAMYSPIFDMAAKY